MLRTIADRSNLVARTLSIVQHLYPQEEILFASAATVLETRPETAAGWSLQRFFQRRGNVVVTDSRFFVQSSFLSLLTIVWLAVLAFAILQIVNSGHFLNHAIAITSLIFLVQRRPYSRDIPFVDIQRIEFGDVQGMAGRCDTLTILVEGTAIHLVTAQHQAADLRERLIKIAADFPQT